MRAEITLNGKPINEMKGEIDLDQEAFLDYCYIGGCKLQVAMSDGQECDCDNPTIAVVWWHVTKDLEPIRPMPVCTKHFQQILNAEAVDNSREEQMTVRRLSKNEKEVL